MSEVTLVVVGREEVNCGGETVGRLVPPSVVSAMVGAEHISGLGDNRVDFESFLVVLTLQVSGEILKKDYKDAIHPQAQASIVYWHKEKHHGKNHSYFPSSKSHSWLKRGMAHHVYDNCVEKRHEESHSGHLLRTNRVARGKGVELGFSYRPYRSTVEILTRYFHCLVGQSLHSRVHCEGFSLLAHHFPLSKEALLCQMVVSLHNQLP